MFVYVFHLELPKEIVRYEFYIREKMTTTDFIETTLGAAVFLGLIIYPIVALAKVDKKKEENSSDHS